MAPSSSPVLPSPSKKLLIADPKSKSKLKLVSGTLTPLLNSASSSSTTTMPPPEKRTRDQPNLSDCHCCGHRINHSNPKDRLQPLDSIWRIVLLCRKCREKLNSGQTCPYCFQQTVNSNDLFKCTVCQRKIHKDCARDYSNCTPWCYLGVGWRFRVCVDCWVPDSLRNSIRVCGRSENKGACKDKGDSDNSLEETAKHAKSDMAKKVKMAAKAREQVPKKAPTAKNPAKTNHTSDLVASKDKNDQKGGISDCSDEIEVSEDAELAFQLHRAMNSSPRILRGNCLVNSCSDVLKTRDPNVRSCLRGEHSEGQSANSSHNEEINSTGKNSTSFDVNGPLTYERDRKRKVWHIINKRPMVSKSRSSQLEDVKFNLYLTDARTVCPITWDDNILETLLCVSAYQSGSCINTDRFGQEPVVYKRTRFRQKVCQGIGLVECNYCDDQGLIFKFQNLQLDDIKQKLPLLDTRTNCLVKGDTEVILSNGSCIVEGDRYLLKYGKRVAGSKSGPTCSRSDCLVKGDAKVILPHGSCDAEFDRFSVKYSKRITGTKSGAIPTNSDCPVKVDTEVIFPNKSCNVERDRYFLKYGKRVVGAKSGPIHVCADFFQGENGSCAPWLSNSGTDYSAQCDGKFTLPKGSSDEEPDRYCFKYFKRVKIARSGSVVETNLQSDAIQNENQVSAPRLTMNCSAESRTVSDVSFESFTINP